MSFVVEAVDSGFPTEGYSTPTRATFCVSDSGAGGIVYINGLGITNSDVAGAVDLATLFGDSFRSIQLLEAFRAASSDLAMLKQFNTYLDFDSNFQAGVGVAGALGFTYVRGLSGGPANATYFAISGPSLLGTWRVNLILRNTIRG